MTTINPTASTGNSAQAALNKSKSLSQTDFMTLLTEQMRNQDPTKPMDSSQMLSQMAQISQISASQELQASFDALSTSLQGNQLLQATALVGHEVTLPADTGLLEGGHLRGAIDASTGGNGQVLIKDRAGNVVRHLSLGPVGGGLASFDWDGTGDNGQPLPAGPYSLAAQVGPTAVATYVTGQVSGVGASGADGIHLDVNGYGSVLLGQVTRIN